MVTRYTIDDIAPLLALRERDDLSFAELSRRCGIQADTLRRWERRLSDESRGGFARVQVARDEGDDVEHGAVRVAIGPGVIEVDRSSDRAALELAVDVLLDRC
jgi:transposase-like protein